MAGPSGASELHDNSTDIRADVKPDGAAPAVAGVPAGVALEGYDVTNDVMRVVRVDSSGAIVTASTCTTNVAAAPGANFGAKLQAAHDAGGTILDCRCLTGPQTMSTDVTFSHSVEVILGDIELSVTNDAQFKFNGLAVITPRPPSACADQSIFRGVGKQSTIIPADVRPSNKPLFLVNAYDCTFRDFYVTTVGSDALDLAPVFDLQPDALGSVLRNRIVNVLMLHGSEGYGAANGGVGIRLGQNADGFYVDECRIAGYTYGVLVQDNGPAFSPNAVTIKNTRIDHCVEGVRVENFGKELIIESCIIEGEGNYGLHVMQGIHILSTETYYETPNGTDIQVDQADIVESVNDRFDGSTLGVVNDGTGKVFVHGGTRARDFQNNSTGRLMVENTWRQAGALTGPIVQIGFVTDVFNRYYIFGDSTSDALGSYGADLTIQGWKTVIIGGDGSIVGDETYSIWMVQAPVAWGTQHPLAIVDTGGNFLYQIQSLGRVSQGSTYIYLNASDTVSQFLLLVADGTNIPAGTNQMFAVTDSAALFDQDNVTDFGIGISVANVTTHRIAVQTKDAATSGVLVCYNSGGNPIFEIQNYGRMEAGATTFSRRLGDAITYTARGLTDDQNNYQWVFTSAGYLAIGPNPAATVMLFMTELKVLTGNVATDDAAGIFMAPSYDAAFTVTEHIYVSYLNPVLTNGAAVTDAVIGFFDAALGTHKATTNADKTANAKPGTLKVDVNGTIYHIQLYAT